MIAYRYVYAEEIMSYIFKRKLKLQELTDIGV